MLSVRWECERVPRPVWTWWKKNSFLGLLYLEHEGINDPSNRREMLTHSQSVTPLKTRVFDITAASTW